MGPLMHRVYVRLPATVTELCARPDMAHHSRGSLYFSLQRLERAARVQKRWESKAKTGRSARLVWERR